MVAGILCGLSHGWDFERCLRFGAAAGAANAGVWEVAASSRGQIEALESGVEITAWR
jgi:fructose-1-phosphate kinase PfkB-like protein